MIKLLISILILNSLTGCATPGESLLTGAAIGGTTGAVIGHQRGGPSSKSKVTGALIGSALGGMLGYFSHKSKIKKIARKTSKKGKAYEKNNPFLTKPKVQMYWEPDQIKGNKYIEKHRVWILEQNPVWTKRN